MRPYPRMLLASIFFLSFLAVLCFSHTAFGFDLNIREYYRLKVEKSDNFTSRINTKLDQYVYTPSLLMTKFAQGGFSTLEKRSGLNEKNKDYQNMKNSILRKVGFRVGVAEGTKDFFAGTVSLFVQLDSLPARMINLAYNVKEKPQEFREKMINSGKSIAGILTNPLSTCKSIYHVGKNMFAEAQKDPLKAGKLQGEIAVFGGTLLLGGGQVKSVAKTGVVVTNAVKTGAMANRANLGILANTASWAEKMNSSITAFSASIPRIDLIFTRPTLNVAIDTTLKKPSKISGSYCEQSFLNSRSLHFSIKNLSKELNGGFLGGSLQYSYKVGDKIDGIAITGKKENRLFLQNKGILYENTINEDVPKISKFINFEQVGDVWKASGKIADGTYAYVISKDNQLLIAGRKFNHSWLTGGEPVRYAGELTFKNGKFINWNNKSGHYLPDPEDALNVKHIIKGVLNEGDNFVAIGREQIRNQIKNQIRKMN